MNPLEPIDPLDIPALRAFVAEATEQLAAYWDRLKIDPTSLPVLSSAKPGEIAAMFPERAPERGVMHEPGAAGALVRDVVEVVMPGVTHWQHPSFFAYFPSNISAPSVAAELLCAGLGVQGMLWATSPACTEVETRVLDWLGAAIGLPVEFLSASATGGGVIQGTASEAVLAALCAARARCRERGARGELVVYASTQAHSSVLKAAMIAGVAAGADDHEHFRAVPTDGEYRMRVDALAAAVREDLGRGRVPCMVSATVGTTGSTAVDSVSEIVGAVERAAAGRGSPGPWVHVDAAHAGAACVCPEYQGWLAGVARADSVCFNPHKWLLTNFDCDCFWTRDRRALTGAMSVTPEYLRNPASDAGSVIDYRDWHVPLGRRFRALKLWMVLRWYGLEGLREYVRGHIAMAAEFEGLVSSDERFEIATPRTMNLVCFRLRGATGEPHAASDARNKRLMEAINAAGRMYLTHTVLPAVEGVHPSPRLVLRMAIGSAATRREHVLAAWEEIRRHAATLGA